MGGDPTQDDPYQTPGEAQSGGLDKELGHDVPPFGPHRLADADLPDPLRDRDQHDVHDADAPYQQGDGGDASQEHGHQIGDLRHRPDHVLLAGDKEVVISDQAVPFPEDVGDLQFGCFHEGLVHRLNIDDLHHLFPPGGALAVESRLKSGQGYQHHIVGEAETATPLALQDPDNLHLVALDPDPLAQGAGIPEEKLGHVGAQDHHLGPAGLVGPADEFTVGYRGFAYFLVLRGNAYHLGSRILAAGQDLGAGRRLGSHQGHGGGPLDIGYRLGILHGEGGPGSQIGPYTAVGHRPGADEEKIGSQPLDAGGDSGLGPLAYGHEGDDGAYPDDDAQHGQRGPHFVDSQAPQGNNNRLDETHFSSCNGLVRGPAKGAVTTPALFISQGLDGI